MSSDYYREGRNYELFIRKVFNCKKGKKYGADRLLLIELFEMEQTKSDMNKHIPYSRQLFKVKLYIERALLKTKKKKMYIDSFIHFSSLQVKLSNANTPDDLSKVVNASLSKIIVLENEMKRRSF